MTEIDPTTAEKLEAAAFRRLVRHLRERSDVQNITLMTHAGFCRNCLADWFRAAATEAGLDISKDAARERLYGMPYEEWKARHSREPTPEEAAALKAHKPHSH